MKVLDPQSALLTNAEVHHFLKTTTTRPPDKRIGAYDPINLKDYHNVKQDFDRYINLTSPHISAFPPPETYMDNVIARLRSYNLTKTEALMILNLGIGLDRPAIPEQPPTAVPESNISNQPSTRQGENDSEEELHPISTDTNPDPDPDPVPESSDSPAAAAEAAVDIQISETYHQYILARVVENIEERFPGEEGERKVQELLGVLRECITLRDGLEGEQKKEEGGKG